MAASQSFLNGSAASTSGEVSDGSFSPPPLQVRAPPSQQAPAAGPHHPGKSTEAPAPAGSKFLNERPALWHNITERLLYHEAVGSNSKAQKMEKANVETSGLAPPIEATISYPIVFNAIVEGLLKLVRWYTLVLLSNLSLAVPK